MKRVRAPGSIALAPRPPGRRAQRGAALLIILAILMVGVLYTLFSSLNEATATAPLQRSQQNAEVLRQAKDALIAFALQMNNGPGHLPCPDRGNDGNSDGAACASPATRIGRLPWRSLGLPDIRDSSGERLWYAVSRCFLERPFGTDTANCPNEYRVTSDEPGGLRLGGLAPASNVVALVFAPGAAIAGQVRNMAVAGPDPKTAICNVVFDNSCRVANYLEAGNATADDVFVAATACEGGDPAKCPLGPINDQLIVITEEDLFRAVEEEVRVRLERDFVPTLMGDYVAKWRTALGLAASATVMPYAAPYMDGAAVPSDPTRTQDFYRGTLGQTVGLLPITRDTTNFLVWDTAPGAVTVETRAPPGSGLWGPAALASVPADTPTSLDFQVIHDGISREYRVQARLRNAGLTFALPIVANPVPPDVPSASVLQSFDASADLLVTYTMTVGAAVPAGPYPLSVPKPGFSVVTSLAALQWFYDNRWYQHVLYAVSPGVVPGSPGFTGSCMAPPGLPPCVVVQSARPDQARTDAQFALVLAGRNIKPTPRAWVVDDYFEGLNATAAGAPVLEQRLRGPQFNDKVVSR